MDERPAPETLRDVVQRMWESADFYQGIAPQRHDPTCWKLHTACALQRVLDILDGEEDEEF